MHSCNENTSLIGSFSAVAARSASRDQEISGDGRANQRPRLPTPWPVPHCALEAGAETIYSWNTKDFLRLPATIAGHVKTPLQAGM